MRYWVTVKSKQNESISIEKCLQFVFNDSARENDLFEMSALVDVEIEVIAFSRSVPL